MAADGAVDWLCVPRFDSPSVFGALLDREAGVFRLGPYGINVPVSRAYEAGTNTLVTIWRTPTGWVEVRDALTMGPRQGEDQVTPHTRPPADEDADHLLVRTARCLEGQKEGTFSICSFWLVSALAVVGEQDRARDLMEKLLRISSPLGLFAERLEEILG